MSRMTAITFLYAAACGISFGQVPGGTWGPWSRQTTATTGMETRVKCEHSVGSDSMWSYQFRNLNDHTVDVVEKEQHGLAKSRINGFGAASMFTLEAGKESFPYETVMHGSCHMVHDMKIVFVCVVPTGEDHPCFKNKDGSSVQQKASQPATRAESNVPGPAVPPGPPSYGFCAWTLGLQKTLYISAVSEGPPIRDQFGANPKDPANLFWSTARFKTWMQQNYPAVVGDNGANSPYCYAGTRDVMTTQRQAQVNTSVNSYHDQVIEIAYPPPN